MMKVTLGGSALGLALLCRPSVALAQPYFVDDTPSLGSPQPCDTTNEGCWTHYVLMTDLDRDGDLDLLFAAGGGYYTPGEAEPFIVYRNEGAGAFDVVTDAPIGAFRGRVRQVAVGDVDGDGDLDLYLPQAYGEQADGIADALFINDGAGHFTDEATARLGITSRAGATRFGDVDGDGDLDLLVADWGDTDWDANPSQFPTSTLHLYRNDGTGRFAEASGSFPAPWTIGTGPIDLDLFDADGDFDLDVLVGTRLGAKAHLLINDGTGRFDERDIPIQGGTYEYGPDACDIDGDGDLDMIVDNSGTTQTSNTQVLVNDGNGNFADETAARLPMGDSANGDGTNDDNRVTCADLDGDGALDLVVASLSTPERVLRNDGAGVFLPVPGAFPSPVDATLGLDIGDVNGDQVPDVITAQGEAGSFLNRLYLGDGSWVLPDTRGPVVRALEPIPSGAASSGASISIHFAVVDGVVTDTGPRIRRAYLEVAGSEVPARFVGGDLFRADVTLAAGASGTYRACAIDWAGNQGCSESATFGEGAGGGGGGGGGGAPPAAGPSAESDGCGCTTPRASVGSWMQILACALGSIAFAGRARRRRSAS